MENVLVVDPISLGRVAAVLPISLLTLVLPGWFLSMLLLPPAGGHRLTRAAMAIVLSISVNIILATIVLAANLPIAWLLAFMLACTAALGLAAWLHRAKAGPPTQAERGGRAHLLLLGAFVLFTLLAIWRFSVPINRFLTPGDFWSYLAYVRKWATWGMRFLGDPRLGTANQGFRHIFGGWLLLQSLMSLVSGVDPLDLSAWWIPPILLTVSYLSLYGLAQALFRSRSAAILSCLVQLLYLGLETKGRESAGLLMFTRINEDKFLLTFVLLPIITIFMANYVRDRRKGDLAGLALLGIAMPLVHPLGLAEVGLTFGLFSILLLVFSRQREMFMRLACIAAPLLLALTIPLLQQAENDVPREIRSDAGYARIEDRFHENHLLVLDRARNLYMVHPHMLRDPLTIAALALAPLLLFYVKKDMGAQYVLANMLGLAFLLFNPIITPLLGLVVTPWMLWRLVYMLPTSLTLGFLLHKGMELLQAQLQRRGVRQAEVFSAAAPLALLLVAQLALGLAGAVRWPTLPREPAYQDELDILLQARRFIREPSVIICSAPAQRMVPAIVPTGFVATWASRTPVEEEITAFYTAPVTDRAAWEVVPRYNGDYVIADKEQGDQLFLPSALLTPLCANERYALYRVALKSADDPLLLANSYLAQGDWEAALAAYADARATSPLLARLRAAEVMAKQGRAAEAEAAYGETIALYPESVWPRLFAAQFHQAQGDPEAALAHYAAAWEISPQDSFLPATALRALAEIDRRGISLLTTVPASERQRWGVGINLAHGAVERYDLPVLGVGWYTDWEVQTGPRTGYPLEHAQTVLVSADAYPPDWAVIDQALQSQPGQVWLIGIWPEWEAGGNRTPEEYAAIYGEVYRHIKGRDISAIVAPGGIMQATPARLAWLDAVLEAYQQRYHHKLPADAWQIGNYILREEAGSWGAGIPVGLDWPAGALYEIADNADAALFAEQVRSFRRWMADHGERDKPLIISLYGVQMPSDYLSDAGEAAGDAQVVAFMRQTFDYLASATDEELGYPADGDRLVQRWLWYSANEPAHDPETGQANNGTLFHVPEGESRPQLSAFGQAFIAYMEALP